MRTLLSLLSPPRRPPSDDGGPPSGPQGPPSPVAIATASVVFYALMAAIGVAIMALTDVPLIPVIFGDGATVLRDAGLGAGAGLVVVALSWLVRDLKPMRDLNDYLSSQMGPLGTATIAILAVTSGIGEELLFRGAIQAHWGLWLTALVFGVVHGGPAKRLRWWVIFAFAAGILLGGLAEFTGNLLAPILCHLTINFWNMHAMDDGPRVEGWT